MITMLTKALVIAYLLDLAFGDPRRLPHPICLIGNLISKGEKIARRVFSKTPKGEIAGGMVMSSVVVLLSCLVPLCIINLFDWIFTKQNWGFDIVFLLNILMGYQILATKSLKTETMKVYHKLKSGNIVESRYALSMIVGRDTENLNEEQITKAAVETVAENTSDGVIAPMFYFIIGGAPLAFAYKAINTLDSMIGYKNDKYLCFGRFAAILDDVANFIPARITGILMIVSAFVLGYDGKNGWKIFKRDRKKHASPNSAQSESACAGALNIQLAGDAMYFGKLYKKPFIGDKNREIEPEDIKRAIKLLYATGIIMLTIIVAAVFIGKGII